MPEKQFQTRVHEAQDDGAGLGREGGPHKGKLTVANFAMDTDRR